MKKLLFLSAVIAIALAADVGYSPPTEKKDIAIEQTVDVSAVDASELPEVYMLEPQEPTLLYAEVNLSQSTDNPVKAALSSKELDERIRGHSGTCESIYVCPCEYLNKLHEDPGRDYPGSAIEEQEI